MLSVHVTKVNTRMNNGVLLYQSCCLIGTSRNAKCACHQSKHTHEYYLSLIHIQMCIRDRHYSQHSKEMYKMFFDIVHTNEFCIGLHNTDVGLASKVLNIFVYFHCLNLNFTVSGVMIQISCTSCDSVLQQTYGIITVLLSFCFITIFVRCYTCLLYTSRCV